MIESILGAISVLLVFEVLFVDITTRKVYDFIGTTKPHPAKKEECKSYNRERKGVVLFTIISTFIVNVTAYLFLPTTVKMIGASSFMIWSFDVISTAFLLIEFLLICLGVYMVYLLYRILRK